MPLTVKAVWESYLEGLGNYAGEAQQLDQQSAFYAGGLAVGNLIMQAIWRAKSEDESTALISAIKAELVAHFERVDGPQNGAHAKPKGAH